MLVGKVNKLVSFIFHSFIRYSFMGYFFTFVPLFRSACTNNIIFCGLITCDISSYGKLTLSRYKEIANIIVTVFWKTVHLSTFHISRNTGLKY